MDREKFSSRLGFILISAGCAIGLGNVWRFPYIVGQYGGAAFVLIYLVFLLALGLPIVVMEFAVGRASQKSAALSYEVLEPKGSKWHLNKYIAFAGNYLLMMFYTTVAGWMILYFAKMAMGDFTGLDAAAVAGEFGNMLANPQLMMAMMVIVVLLGFGTCGMGLQNGVEKVTKWMMVCLLLLMVVLAGNSMMIEGGGKGLEFYLLPDFSKVKEAGLGEAVSVLCLDTLVAFMAGLIIFPACFAYGVEPDAGPSLIFITLPNVFNHMSGGRLWGSLFFLFMSFAAMSTVIAVFQNIVSFATDLTGCTVKKAVVCNIIAVILLSIPCVLGFNAWSGFEPLGPDTNVLDLEDFLVSNNLLPIGSLIYLLFCTSRYGWGFEKFLKEANAGTGLKFPKGVRWYVSYILPIVILGIFLQGYWAKFSVLFQ